MTDFPWIDNKVMAQLDDVGINDSQQLIAAWGNKTTREKLAQDYALSLKPINELVYLSD